MATKTVHLTIPAHCPQRWEDMKAEEMGRFCASCQKTVVDFSSLTDRQLINLLARKNGSTCGRFRANQLNREVTIPASVSPPFVRLFGLLTAGLLGLQAAQADTLLAPPEPTRQHITDLAIRSVLPIMGEDIVTDSVRVIRGRVVEETIKEVLPGAFVSIQGTSISTNTDAEGNFQLRIPAEHNDKVITLRIGWIGYKTSEMQIRPDQSTPLVVTLQEDQALLGEVVVVGKYKKNTFFQRLWNRLQGRH